MQAITSFAGIFFFSAVPKATADLASSLIGFRTVIFSFPAPSSENSYDELNEIIAGNDTAIPESCSFVFYSGENYNLVSDTVENSRAEVVSNGRKITAEDVENRARGRRRISAWTDGKNRMIIALFNLCFVYKFILQKMSGYFAVLRICGDSSKGLIYAVYGIILTASFAVGAGVFLS